MLKFKFPPPFNDGDDDDGAGGFSSKFEASVPRQKGEGGSEASKQHRFNVITNFLFFCRRRFHYFNLGKWQGALQEKGERGERCIQYPARWQVLGCVNAPPRPHGITQPTPRLAKDSTPSVRFVVANYNDNGRGEGGNHEYSPPG